VRKPFAHLPARKAKDTSIAELTARESQGERENRNANAERPTSNAQWKSG